MTGTQYVAFRGGGVSIQTSSGNSDTIWVFSLKGSPGDRLKPFAAPTPPENVVGFSGPIARSNTIRIDDFTYGPIRTTVATGTKVTFTNAGTQAHNATSSEGGGFDTGMLAKGETAGVTFNQPGTYTYVCSPHPSMIGQLIVTGPAIASMPATVVESNAARPAQTNPAANAPHGAH